MMPQAMLRAFAQAMPQSESGNARTNGRTDATNARLQDTHEFLSVLKRARVSSRIEVTS